MAANTLYKDSESARIYVSAESIDSLIQDQEDIRQVSEVMEFKVEISDILLN